MPDRNPTETDFRPLVLVPTYNTGPRLRQTLEEILEKQSNPILVVVDGSDDGSDDVVQPLVDEVGPERMRAMWLEKNEGKGWAVLVGATVALREDSPMY